MTSLTFLFTALFPTKPWFLKEVWLGVVGLVVMVGLTPSASDLTVSSTANQMEDNALMLLI